ncbi:MAG: DsrE/DsrF/DrsH-like family protein [Burkholderiales bacterium]|nr:DsrE/DsrF/DrsH-like family protein [Burkholderiales bacterium]
MEARQKKMAIIASKGTLDMGYPPLILATTAAALGYEVQVFFTFYGLQLLRKSLKHVQISPLANPAMPMPVPMPVLVSAIPGMQKMATTMMKQKIKKHGVASLEDLRTLAIEADVKLIACQMTIDLFEFKKSEFIDGIDYGGAATFLEFASEADITLFV